MVCREGSFQITLCDQSDAMISAWQSAFESTPIEVVKGDILAMEADAWVSPANAFGFMKGGLDRAYCEHFGWALEAHLQEKLRLNWQGELPVGMAIMLPIPIHRGRFLVSAPTMRVPSTVSHTAHAYLAFKAALRVVVLHNRLHGSSIKKLVCPGLGTGVGQMPAERCARQMRHAYDVIFRGALRTVDSMDLALRDHMMMLR